VGTIVAQKLLLHCDGVDASTVFTDNGPSSHAVTANGDAQIDTTQSKFGGTSGVFDGNADELSIPTSVDFDFVGGAGNYTFTAWVKYDDGGGPSGNRYIVTHREDASNRWMFFHNSSGSLDFQVISVGSTVVTLNGGSIADGDWHWVAIIKVGTEYGIYLDGAQTAYVNDASTDTFTGALLIGNIDVADATQGWNGWIDETYLSSDNIHGASPVVGLSDTITVPTAPYISSSGIHSIFHWEPDYNDIVSGQTFNTQVTSLGVETEQRRAKWSKPKYSATLSFQQYLSARGVAAEIWDFFIARRGQYDWFWLPSYKHDTFLTQDYTSGEKIYVDKNDRFTPTVEAHGNYVYISDGTNYEVKQVTSVGSDTGDYIFIVDGFDNQYAIDTAKGKKVWIQTAYKVRFASDDYSEDNMADFVHEVGISFIEVFQK
jgi:hypothetical protein